MDQWTPKEKSSDRCYKWKGNVSQHKGIEDWSGLFFFLNLQIKSHAFLGKINVVHLIWMCGRVGSTNNEAGLKPRKTTKSLWNNVKKSGLFATQNRVPPKAQHRRRGLPVYTAPAVLGSCPADLQILTRVERPQSILSGKCLKWRQPSAGQLGAQRAAHCGSHLFRGQRES